MSTLQETTHDHRNQSLAAKAGRFLWQWVQLFLAMEVGMILYHLLVGKILAGTSFAALARDSRPFGFVMMVVFIALGMIGLLRIRRGAWKYSRKMTTVVIASLAALTVLVVMALLPT